MNRLFHFLLLLALCVGMASNLSAQGADGTDDDGFVVQITTPASIAQNLFNAAECGWEGSTYGPSITADQAFCGDVVWAKDSLGCTPITNNLTGKIALLRRGTCNFSLKVYHAQQAGAIAAVITNHYTTATDGPCTWNIGGMSGGDSAAAVVIPSILIHRQTAEQIDAAIKAAQPVTLCFAFPRMSGPTSASMYATPLSQVDTMQAITVNYNNRSGATQTDVNLKAEFFGPSGSLLGSVTYNMPVCEPNADSFIVFPSFYAAPAKGKHTVRFTNDKYTESIDTVYSYYEHTDYTFATDNLVVDPGGVGPADADFAAANFYIQSGGLCLTGDAPAKATYATFGISNIEAVYVPGSPSANIIGIAVYKADVDGDGAGDLSSSFVDDLGAGLIAYVDYEMTGNEVNDEFISVPLTDLATGDPGVNLDPNSGYYVSLIYDGTEAGTSVCVRFINSLDVGYASFTGYPTTPLYFGQLYTGGWSGAMVAQRLELDGFTPGSSTNEPKKLADTKFSITPNPANEFVNLNLKLNDVNPAVSVSILDANGRVAVGTQVQKNIQEGVMSFNVKSLPSGTYYMWVRTAEGSTLKPIAICH